MGLKLSTKPLGVFSLENVALLGRSTAENPPKTKKLKVRQSLD
jgi:hypothetical protein